MAALANVLFYIIFSKRCCWIHRSFTLHKLFILKPKITLICFHSLYHSLSLVVPLVVICSHSLSLVIIHCHSFSFVVTRCTTRCHSLPFAVPLVVIRCHSFSLVVTRYHSLSVILIRCHSLCYSLSLVAIRCTTRCHSLSLVVTRCTTRLCFYKRSISNVWATFGKKKFQRGNQSVQKKKVNNEGRKEYFHKIH